MRVLRTWYVCSFRKSFKDQILGQSREFQAYRDSAGSYYLEALVIFNALGEKNYLQELFLKYLQLAIVISNIEGGKTTADDWENWTLHQLQIDCIKADSLEEKKVFFMHVSLSVLQQKVHGIHYIKIKMAFILLFPDLEVKNFEMNLYLI